MTIFLLSVVSGGCNLTSSRADRVVIIQPLGDMPAAHAKVLLAQLKEDNPGTFLRKSVPLPDLAFHRPRSRYRADSLLRYLGRSGNRDTVVIGVTGKDISTAKD